MILYYPKPLAVTAGGFGDKYYRCPIVIGWLGHKQTRATANNGYGLGIENETDKQQ